MYSRGRLAQPVPRKCDVPQSSLAGAIRTWKQILACFVLRVSMLSAVDAARAYCANGANSGVLCCSAIQLDPKSRGRDRQRQTAPLGNTAR